MPTPNKSLAAREIWKVLRVKAGSADDDDYVADNTPPADEDVKKLPIVVNVSYGIVTDVCVAVYALDASGDIVYDADTRMTLTGIEVIDRSHPRTGAGVDAVPGVQKTGAVADVELQEMVLVPCNGAQSWTVRVTDVTDPPATVDSYEIWYREYSQ